MSWFAPQLTDVVQYFDKRPSFCLKQIDLIKSVSSAASWAVCFYGYNSVNYTVIMIKQRKNPYSQADTSLHVPFVLALYKSSLQKNKIQFRRVVNNDDQGRWLGVRLLCRRVFLWINGEAMRVFITDLWHDRCAVIQCRCCCYKLM